MEKTTRKRSWESWEWLHSRWLPYVLLALFMLFVHAGMDTRVGDDKVNLQVLSEIGGGAASFRHGSPTWSVATTPGHPDACLNR